MGVLPLNMLAEWIDFPPPAALWRAIALEPANTSYEVRILPPNRVKIQGKLIGLYRKY